MKKMVLFPLLLSLFLLPVHLRAQAAVIFDNTSNARFGYVGQFYYLSQQFFIRDGRTYIEEVVVYLERSIFPGNFTISIYSGASNFPGTKVADIYQGNQDNIPYPGGQFIVNGTNTSAGSWPLTLPANGEYWLLISATNEFLVTWAYTLNNAGTGSGYSTRWGNGNDLGVMFFSDNQPFLMKITANTVLPVELTAFTASLNGNSVELLWNTVTESQNYGFDIERRAKSDNAAWQNIGFVPGSGNSNAPKSYAYTDNTVTTGGWQYRLKQIDTDGSVAYSGVVDVLIGTPMEFSLSQNFPNPFNPSTTITFDVPVKSAVTLTIFNALGETVQQLASGLYEPGRHSVTFNAANLPSGVYFYRLQAGEFVQTQKMVLMR